MALAYIISPQCWDGFFVSKHHYALALADQGWQVVFIDPPTCLGKRGAVDITNTAYARIKVLRYQTGFPYELKFRARWIFDLLMHRQARRLVAVAGFPDLVWDFDNSYQFRDLRVFGAATTLFHLVDDVGLPGLGDKHSDHLFYLHPSFCINAGGTLRKDHEIGHGLGRMFETAARNHSFSTIKSKLPHVGFVGNLKAAWIDWAAIEAMLYRHPGVRFTFWGPLPNDEDRDPALVRIHNHANSTFPGLTTPENIVLAAPEVDVWLVPFLGDKLLGGPLNSHKILEYLSTGKAVVMNWLEAYDNNPLVYSAPKSDAGDGLANLLAQVLLDLGAANSPEMMSARRAFALERSYDLQLRSIFNTIGLDDTLNDAPR